MSTAPVFVSADAVRSVFSWSDAVTALRAAYSKDQPRDATPPRSIATDRPAWLRVLPSMPAGDRYFGAKIMGSPGATTPPRVEYVIVLFDRLTGRIAAFLDANVITGLRTAATSAVAVDRLASQRPIRLAVLGSGFEAAMHTRAIAAIRPLTDVTVYSPTLASRQRFAAAMSAELNIPVRPADDARTAVGTADVVVAAARSRGEQPILYADWLAPTATVVSIGSTIPAQREIDASVVEWADLIVCDVLDEVLDATGDMLAATAVGMSPHHKSISLTDLLSAETKRTTERPMFKSVGSGLQDMVVAGLVLDKATAAGLATELPITFETKD